MNPSRSVIAIALASLTALAGLSASSALFAQASTGGIDISQQPLFTITSQPPLNMLVMGRDHKLYYEAYNDASDLNGDGVLDVGYKPTQITYYGYFDSNRCYSYASGRFTPGAAAPNKTCSGAWSGDFLNYLTTSRMDALRKVFYGGYRITDTNAETVLERANVPQDAHSWGKEYTSTAVDGYNIASYAPLSQPGAGTRHLFANTTLINSEASGPLLRVLQNSPFRIWNWVSIERPVAGDDCFINGSSTRVNCLTGGGAAGGAGAWAIVPTTAFSSGLNQMTWKVASSQGSPANLAGMNTMYGSGTGGFATNANRCTPAAGVTIANINGAGNPGSGTNGCTNDYYMNRITGTLTVPVTGAYQFAIDGDDAVDFSISGAGITTQNIGFYGAHSACNCQNNAGASITLTAGVTYTVTFRHKEDSGDDVYRLYWRPPGTVPSTRDDYVVRVEVCKAGVLESNCKAYPNGNKKPTGILHDYGESDRMYFGLMTGTYAKNTQGGVIRSNMGSFTRELSLNTGIFNAAVTDGIVSTINKLRTIDFGTGYAYSCGWITTRPVNDGECSMWGNPIGEMMYETLRYFGGAATARSEFNIGTGDKDALAPLSLARPAWKSPYKPVSEGGSGYLACSAPAMTVVSDINPSYDSSLPGSNWGAISAGSDPAPINTLDVGAQVDAIWAAEGGGTKSIFIGEAGGVADGAPTVKSVSNLSTVRGLAPEEPSKQGTYYSAGVARFGALNKIGGDQRVQTYSVALASPLPRIDFPVGNGRITLVPFAKSVRGDSISATGTFQPTDQIVDYYVQKIANTDVNGSDRDTTVNGGRPYAEFRINFEDVEQGADHDMDAIALYTLAVNAAGTLDVTLRSEYAAGGIDQHMGYVISGTNSDGIYLDICDLGDGRTNDGTRGSCAGQVYYKLNTPPGRAPGWCDNNTSAECIGLPPTNTRNFAAGSTAGAGVLKGPLWYAAKYGTPAGLPSVDDAGEPLNYFLVTNALGLRAQLDQAFQNIIANSLPSASVATSSPRYISGSTLAYEVSYNSEDWTGDVRAYKLSADGTYAGTSPVWSASQRMPAHGSRKIFTSKRSGTAENGSTFTGTVFKNDTLTTGQRAEMALGAIPAVPASIDESLVNYLRGDKSKELGQTGCTPITCPYRKRTTKVGDILNSTPAVSGVASYGYSLLPATIAGAAAVSSYEAHVASKKTIYGASNNQPIIFVGANDGMLHAFDGRDGSAGGVELFSFIPYSALRNVAELARPSYTHRYFVDGTPTIGDAYLSNAWKTVLVSSVGAGAKGVFALDISDPRNFTENKVLWEFNSTTDADMGQFVGRPSIGLTQDRKWVAVFGNGYNSANQRAILHIRDLATGAQIAKIDTGVGCSRLLTTCTTGPNGLATATLVDNTGDGVGDTIYAGDYLGNLWRFDLSSAGVWSVGNAGRPIFVAKDGNSGTAKTQSITSGVYTVAHPLGGTMVIFGTGRYLNADDADDGTLGLGTRSAVDTVYGIWDATRVWDAENAVWTTTATSSTGATVNLGTLMAIGGRADLQPQSFSGYTPLADDGSGGYRTGTRNPVEFRTPDSPGSSSLPRYMGWYVDLRFLSTTNNLTRNLLAGERVTATPQGILNDVVVNTFRPSGNSCKPGAQNATLVFDALTGGASFTPIVPTGGWPTGQAPPIGAISGTDTGIVPPAGEPPVIVIRPTTPVVPCLPGSPDCDTAPPLNDVKSCSWRSPNAANRTPGKLIPCGRISWKQLR